MHQQTELIDRKLEVFLQRYNEGHRSSSNLISEESLHVRQHITTESGKSEHAIKQHVTAESGKSELAIRQHITHEVTASEDRMNKGVSMGITSLKEDGASEARRERLLASLKYSGMNERRNQVGESFSNTFDWIFAADGDQHRPGTQSVTDDESVSGISNDTGSEAEDNIAAASSDEDLQDDATPSQSDMSDHPADGAGSEEDYGAAASSDEASEDFISSQSDTSDSPVPPDISWDCFSDWLRSDETIYWISGKPGSGKTTLIKHILNHHLTRSCLDVWKPDAAIISHFFWRPGSIMQQNIRGMLSSLIYQLLETQPILADAVLSMPGVLAKDADTDWSVLELRDTLSFVMRADQRPLCVFLDGIDEMYADDGIDRLLELMSQWERVHAGSMKFCLASRRELPIQRRLESHPHLRLEHLVANDLEQYAIAHLQFPKDDIMYEDVENLKYYDISIRSLVDKAEGVFLWLCLAIKDLNRGLMNGDEPKHLQKRIERLHSDIESLYEDMWSRMNDDEEIYRETTALYLRLLIVFHNAGNSFAPPRAFDMFLCSSGIADDVLDGNSPISADNLPATCKRAEQQVLTKCGGLVELFGIEPNQKFNVMTWDDEQHPCLSKYIYGKSFRFIHRTALDFLVDTAKGQKILDHDKTPAIVLRSKIIKAKLAACQLFRVTLQGGKPTTMHDATLRLFDIEYMPYQTLTSQTFETSSLEIPAGNQWQKELWLRLQLLYEEGKLFVRDNVPAVRFFQDKNWMVLQTASLQCLQYYIHFKMATCEWSRGLKSQMLLNILHAAPNVSRVGLIPALLDSGINPNMASSHSRYVTNDSYFLLTTPWALFLARYLIDEDLSNESVQRKFEGMLDAFVRQGADPAAEVYLYFTLDRYVEWQIAFTLFTRPACTFPNDFDGNDSPLSAIVILDATTALEEILRKADWAPRINGAHGLVEHLRSCEKGPSRRQMRAVALIELADTFQPDLTRIIEPSPVDSEYLLEIIQLAWSEPLGSSRLYKGLGRRCQNVIERTPAENERDISAYLERLGIVTRKVYRGGDDYDNPWKDGHL